MARANSLLGVGDSARVQEPVVGLEGVTVVTDVHILAFAVGMAFPFAGPCHAGFLASLRRGLYVVAFGHVADVLVSR